MALFLITSLLNTIEFHFLQPLPCLILKDTEIIESLCEKLRFLQAFLEDSEENNINDQARRVLETEIRDVALDAEGKIESEFRNVYLCGNKEVEGLVKACRSLYQTLQQVMRDIESVERRIQIERSHNHSVEPQIRNRTENIKAGSFSKSSLEPKNVMVGCDDELDTIKYKLISNSKKREVLSIVGMGGIGKTTLARRVYEDASIISRFDIREWTTVSQEHNLEEMLLGLLGSVETNGGDISCLTSQLRQKLMGQRYLVVIDDIWSTKAWDDIHRCFPENCNGSRILLTTRLNQVADYASSEDSEIPVKKVTQLWVAEGFLKLELNSTVEEVAETYLKDLIDRGLVQIDKLSSDGKIKSCRLHDLLHIFCLTEAQKNKLLYVINDNNVQEDPKVGRWISNQLGVSHWPITLERCDTHTSDEFRSVLYFSKHLRFGFKPFLLFKLLRVLDITSNLICSDIHSGIVELVNLRYLALSLSLSIDADLRCLFKLPSLQTVLVEWGLGQRRDIWDSPSDILDTARDILDKPRLRNAHFPYDFSLYLPKLVQGNLRTISWLHLPCSGLAKPDFEKIPNVKELGIHIEKDPIPPGSLDGLADLCQLENLKIRVAHYVGHWGDFRLWTAFPPILKKLTLYYSRLPTEDMAIIGTLSNLEVLKLVAHAFDGPEWKTMENGFRKLKHLQIDISDLKHWSADADHFPVLEHLILLHCMHLEEFPAGFGDITTLQLIELHNCHSSPVTYAKKIQGKQQSFGNDTLVVRDFYTRESAVKRKVQGYKL